MAGTTQNPPPARSPTAAVTRECDHDAGRDDGVVADDEVVQEAPESREPGHSAPVSTDAGAAVRRSRSTSTRLTAR